MEPKTTSNFSGAIAVSSAVYNTDDPQDVGTVGGKTSVPSSNKRKLNIFEHDLVVEKFKAVESGEIKQFQPHSFVLLFENEPWWILALQSNFIKDIAFVKYSSASDLYTYLNQFPNSVRLFNRTFSRIGL